MRQAAKLRSVTPAPRRDSPWMTVKQAAEYLDVGVDLIYEACAKKGLRHAKLGHSTLRTKREWLDAWAEGLSRTREG